MAYNPNPEFTILNVKNVLKLGKCLVVSNYFPNFVFRNQK